MDNFFLLSVSVAQKKKTIMNIIIRGGGRGFGSTWGRNFYMGTQNGSKLDLTCIGGLLIHTFELEISIKMFL